MSDPLDVVRTSSEAFDAGDVGRALSLLAEDVEWDNRHAGAPGLDEVYHGHEGVLSLLSQIVDVFEDYAISGREYEVAGERVLVVAREYGVGLTSGIGDARPLALIYTVRDGLIVHVSTHADVDEARRRFAA